MIAKKTDITPLKFIYYYYPFLFFVFSGLADSAYLLSAHYRNYTDVLYVSFCAVNRAINCDTVAQSKFSIFFDLPVSLWGVAGYLFLFILTIQAKSESAQKKMVWPFIFLVSLSFSICSIFLAIISAFYIKSYCIMCVLSYAINLGCLFYSWIIVRRFGGTAFIKGIVADYVYLKKKPIALFFFAILTSAMVLLWVYLPKYWLLEPDSQITDKIESGLTNDGLPWIGAKDPKLTITEYSDYQCFQCRKLHFFLRRIIAENPDKIRLVHRHYPLDSEFNNIVTPEPFHVGSGKLALVAVYSAVIGKFWDVNDALFKIGASSGNNKFSVADLSGMTGMSENDIITALNHPGIRQKLTIDIWSGMRLGITSTPSLLINDKIYIGQIPNEIIRKAIQE